MTHRLFAANTLTAIALAAWSCGVAVADTPGESQAERSDEPAAVAPVPRSTPAAEGSPAPQESVTAAPVIHGASPAPAAPDPATGEAAAVADGATETDTPSAAGVAPAAAAAPSAEVGEPPESRAEAPEASRTRTEPLRLAPAPSTLLPLVQPLWSELTAPQQQVLEPFAAQWNALPLSEKRAWSELAQRFPKMKPAEQARVQRRIGEWAALTPEQRKLARANYRLARQKARDEVVAEWEGYQAMTPAQRSVLNSAGSTSNTAARHAGAATGLAKEAAQPLPRGAVPRPQIAIGNGTTVSTGGVAATVGMPPASTRTGAASAPTAAPAAPR